MFERRGLNRKLSNGLGSSPSRVAIAYVLARINKTNADISTTGPARSSTLNDCEMLRELPVRKAVTSQELLTPVYSLPRVGLGFVTRGEAVFVFDTVNGGQPTLTDSASAYDISGDTADPDSWLYDCELPTPDGSVSGAAFQVRRSSIHDYLRISPWRRGVSAFWIIDRRPSQRNRISAIQRSHEAKSGYLLPFSGASPTTDPDDDGRPDRESRGGDGGRGWGSTLLLDAPVRALTRRGGVF